MPAAVVVPMAAAGAADKESEFMANDLVIQSKVFDLLDWLLPKAERFPRAYRLTLTQRLMDAALDLQDALIEAQVQRGQSRRRARKPSAPPRFTIGPGQRPRTGRACAIIK